MNSPSSISAAPATTAETNLGWNAMPAYGEVMNELRGLQHMELPSIGAPAAKTNLFMESFWSVVRTNLLAMAA